MQECNRPKAFTIDEHESIEGFLSELSATIKRNKAYGVAVVMHTATHIQCYQFGLDADEMIASSVALDRWASKMIEAETS